MRGLLGLFLLVGVLSAQDQSVWTKTFDLTDNPEGFSSIIATSDGNYLIVGAASTGIYTGDLLMVKFDPSGESIWDTVIVDGGTGKDVIEDSQGNYILCGQSYNPDEKYNHLVMKFDSDGNEVWSFALDSAMEHDYLNSLTQVGENSFMSVGITNQLLNVINFSGDGSVVWNRQFGQSVGYDIAPAWDGGG